MSYDQYRHKEILDRMGAITISGVELGDVEIDNSGVESRLDTVNNNLGTIEISVDAVNSSVGTVNTSVGTVNTNLGTLNTSVGTVNTSVGGVNTSIGTVNTNLGTLNTSVGSVNTSVGTSNTHLSSVSNKLTTANATLSGVATNSTLSSVNTTLTSSVYGKYEGTVRTSDITISGTFPTPLPASPLANRRDYIVMNISSHTIYVGGSTVTASNGIPVVSGTVFSAPLGGATLYGISPATNITTAGVRVMEIS